MTFSALLNLWFRAFERFRAFEGFDDGRGDPRDFDAVVELDSSQGAEGALTSRLGCCTMREPKQWVARAVEFARGTSLEAVSPRNRSKLDEREGDAHSPLLVAEVMEPGDRGAGVDGAGAESSAPAPIGRRTRTWAFVALVGGLLLTLTSIDSLQGAPSAGTVVGGAIDILLGLAVVVAAVAVTRHGEVSRVTILGLLGAAAFGWQYLALLPLEIAALGGSLGLLEITMTLSAVASLAGSVGVSLSTHAYRSATWGSIGNTEDRLWLMLVTGAAVTSVIALFLPYATYKANAKNPIYTVDAWNYFGTFVDTVILVLMLSCGTLAALNLMRPQLPYRWSLACLGLVTFAFIFTPAQFGSTAATGQAVSFDSGFWLILIGALVVSIGGVISWRRSSHPLVN